MDPSSKYPKDPDWASSILFSPAYPTPPAVDDDNYPIQQTDHVKPLLLDISEYGLNYAFHKYYFPKVNPEKYKFTKTKHPKDVIIIGAGPAGLTSGYELARAGHNVQILEMQHRVGGRVKTIGDSKFSEGLWADSGAMRLPGEGKLEQPESMPSHFLVDFYAHKFEIPTKVFVNEDDHGYLRFYGREKIRLSDWNKRPKQYTDKFWPGWDKNLEEKKKMKLFSKFKDNEVNGISDYYDQTTKPITDQLRKWLKADPTHAWTKWVEKWSQFPLVDFLTSTLDQVKSKLSLTKLASLSDDDDLAPLEFLLPWPIQAVIAYSTFTYTEQLDQSLVQYLRDDLGQWWKDPMHTFENGLRMLPQSFLEKHEEFEESNVELSRNIYYGETVHKIKYTDTPIEVVCRNQITGELRTYKGDQVIITLPVHIICQIKFEPPLHPVYYQAFENIFYGPSTKILLQCRTRFWEKDGIRGGFSKTNMPIGQIHYPSNPDSKIPTDERGILMCYTWKQEALIFGSQTPQNAIAEAVREIAEIHPEITENFEVGAIQAWFDDPSAQGAYCLLKPDQYIAVNLLVYAPYESIFYFCGEALSHANGWIQGAMESSLRSAFQLYTHNEFSHMKFPASSCRE